MPNNTILRFLRVRCAGSFDRIEVVRGGQELRCWPLRAKDRPEQLDGCRGVSPGGEIDLLD